MGTPDVRDIHNLESIGNPLKKMGSHKRKNKRGEKEKYRNGKE